MKEFSKLIVKGFSDHHCQGIAIDKSRDYMYFSFTTCLLKTDLDGNVIGSVNGIIGHLGCLAMGNDGRVYSSLEYNDDEIGCGILKRLDIDNKFPNRFYIAIFDVEKIDRVDMNAEKDGIMTAVCLDEVSRDYNYPGHKYGCSGIDGITFAPAPGENEVNSVYVAYGIYGDTKRTDNDHQILLRYDISEFLKYEKEINQHELHTSGPESADDRYFVYTGNTTYGIQNLEYDKDNNCLFAAVYKGKKLRFPNYCLYAIDICDAAETKKLTGLDEIGSVLPLKKLPFFKSRGKITGSDFPYGSTGMISLGNNAFLFSEEFKDTDGHGTIVYSYQLDNAEAFVKKRILL